jgi:hypothetical protein
MLDDNAWSKLINGLGASTRKGQLRWDAKSTRSGDGAAAFGVERMMADVLNRPEVFMATTKTAVYELASGDGFGRAPFELNVWEFRGLTTHPIGSLKSSTSVGVAQSYKLNQQLEELFKVVNASTETSEQIVDRLLAGLGEE